jgi:hypothetical protein
MATADEVREILAVSVDRGLVHVDGGELSERRYFVDPLNSAAISRHHDRCATAGT